MHLWTFIWKRKRKRTQKIKKSFKSNEKKNINSIKNKKAKLNIIRFERKIKKVKREIKRERKMFH